VTPPGQGVRAFWAERSDLIVRTVLAVALALSVFAVLDRGFLPADDALRHAAQAVSGRGPTDFLVTDPNLRVVDATPGWHQVLGTIQRSFGMDQFALVSVAIFLLFMVFAALPLFLFQRAEAWALVLLVVIAIDPAYAVRLALGRPFMVTSTAIAVFALFWERLTENPQARKALLACGLAAAAATYLHSTWYLLYLVPVAGSLSGHWKASTRLAGAITVGILIGAALTLQPVDHLTYQLVHLQRAFTVDTAERAGELTPARGFLRYLLLAGLFVATRRLWPELRDFSLRHVAFLTAGLAWLGSFVVARTWMDLGLPALLIGLALAAERVLRARVPSASATRAILTLGVAGGLFLIVSANPQRRWDRNPLIPLVYLMENPEEVESWLPGPGGIVYSPDINVFYRFFFLYPDREWRYMTGMEPGLMAPQDRAIYEQVHATLSVAPMDPWLRKLRPQDRLILLNLPGPNPWADRNELEVYRTPDNLVIVRLRVEPELKLQTD
jgi:hypothetical protein